MYDLDCLVAAPRVVLLLSFGSSTGLGLDTVIGSFEFFLCCDFLFFYCVFILWVSCCLFFTSDLCSLCCSMPYKFIQKLLNAVICARNHDAMMVSWWDVKSLEHVSIGSIDNLASSIILLCVVLNLLEFERTDGISPLNRQSDRDSLCRLFFCTASKLTT